MSATDKAPRTNTNGGAPRTNRRRRPQSATNNNTNNAAAAAPRKPRAAAAAEQPKEASGEAPKRVRPEPTPIPEHLVGSRQVGTVISVIRKGKYNFGFIALGKDPKPEDNGPRIYFNPSHVTEPGLFLRRSYIVEFKVDKDAEGRSVATEIKLTEEGVTRKAEADEAAAKRRAERQQEQPVKGPETTEGEEGERAPRARRSKRRGPRPEGKKVNLKVTVEGKSGEKTIEFDTSLSIGKLKNVAVNATDAPVEYVVYHKGEFLTKAVFNNFTDGDVVHLAPQKEESK